MRQFVRQRGVTRARRCPIRDKEPLGVVIIEGRRLLGKDIDRAPGQIEIGGNQAELLQGQLFGPQLGRGRDLFYFLLEEFVDLLFADEVAGDFLAEAQSGYAGQLLADGVDFAEHGARVVGRLRYRRNRGKKKRKGAH